MGDGALNAGGDTANTAVGFHDLFNDTTAGNYNTAVGDQALFSNTTGNDNTATGAGALFSNTTGLVNTATGWGALGSNTTGNDNTATGFGALSENTTGANNTGVGSSALVSNTTGNENTATGAGSMFDNTTGVQNTATGNGSLFSTTIGNANTAVGYSALSGNTTGSNNTAIGSHAGINQTTGSNNVYIGAGIEGVAGDDGVCRIASIFNATVAGGTQVFINSANRLGTSTSSRRFKEDIKPMGKVSEALYALKPVTFRYNKKLDPQGISEFGLVAEEVEKVNPDLVVRDKEGKPYSVRYEQINAMLLNEFLKEHKRVQELKATVEKQEVIIAEQQKSFESKLAQQEKSFQSRLAEQEMQIKALASGLQKVSAEFGTANLFAGGVEVNSPARHVVLKLPDPKPAKDPKGGFPADLCGSGGHGPEPNLSAVQ